MSLKIALVHVADKGGGAEGEHKEESEAEVSGAAGGRTHGVGSFDRAW